MTSLAALLLFVASGFTGLVYEVLWMRELGLLFGSTAYAAATTLAVFFLGLAAGSDLWGRLAPRSRNPLRLYGLLEVGVGAAALLVFPLLRLYERTYPALFQTFADSPVRFTAVKAGLAVVMLFPPTMLMGGTLPVMGQHLIRHTRELGRMGTLLYGLNTIGGAAGAFVAGFYLPLAFGFVHSYLLAVGLSVGIGVVALGLSMLGSTHPAPLVGGDRKGDDSRASVTDAAPTPIAHAMPYSPGPPLLPIAFVSGFAALGLEVLWIRMFAQVLHNSVYSFALILVTFLVALALGALLANILCRLEVPAAGTLSVLLLLAGMAAGFSPAVFYWLTGGLQYVAPNAGWGVYVRIVFQTAALVLLVPGILVGSILPFLLHLAQPRAASPGRAIGRLTAINTLGSICGSLIAGFVLLDLLGLWASIRALGVAYLVAAVVVADAVVRRRQMLRAATLASIMVLVTVLDPVRLPIVRIAPRGEVLYESWESGDGIVGVVGNSNNVRIKVDNYYALGGTASSTYEELQADIPIVIEPHPRAVFFLGLGTGITAGAALRHPVERVTTAEIIPAVVTAADKYFGKFTNGLFSDPRSRVVIEDGRNFLRGTAERYDVIVGDLFIPWQAGAGSLYTREQFETVKARLTPGGLFAQWLPLYQLSQSETLIIMKTMLEVFPQVTLWRGDFLPERPIVAVVGEADEAPLDPDAVVRNYRRRRQNEEMPRPQVMALMGLFYAGNLSANRSLFDGVPVNTDDRPLIEYLSPVTQREERTHSASWFTGLALAQWYEALFARTPPEHDPYLRQLTPEETGFVRAGLDLYETRAYAKAGRTEESRRYAEAFRARVPADVAETFKRQIDEWVKEGAEPVSGTLP